MKALLNKIKLAVADSRLGAFVNPVYRLRYVPEGRDAETYLVSRPFDGDEFGMVAYAFGKGVRRFRFDRILEREVVSIF